jgi:hypothetical protein
LNRYAVKQSRGLDGPFIFTSASCAIHARIQAAGNMREPQLAAGLVYRLGASMCRLPRAGTDRYLAGNLGGRAT